MSIHHVRSPRIRGSLGKRPCPCSYQKALYPCSRGQTHSALAECTAEGHFLDFGLKRDQLAPEIAQILGISPGAAKIRLHRACQALWVRMEQDSRILLDERGELNCDRKQIIDCVQDRSTWPRSSSASPWMSSMLVLGFMITRRSHCCPRNSAAVT